MAKSVPWRWLKPHFVVEFIVHIDEHSSSSLNNGQHIFFISSVIGLAGTRAFPCGLVLAPRHDVAGVRECRYPTPVHQTSVPAGMVEMKMGAQHIVDLLRADARICQALQKGTVP